MTKKVAVILSGCGVYDGAEINEVVLTLLSLEENNAHYQCYAPDINQHHVINHIDGNETKETRNVLQDSARIVRGNIKPLTELSSDNYDALIVPGGFGVAKNLSKFAFDSNAESIEASFLNACLSFKIAKKPAGYMCIAPALLPKIYGDGIQCTIGTDKETAACLTKMGASHKQCHVDNIIVDETHKVITTPAYMLANSLVEAKTGISKLVSKVVSMS
ncbi:MAG: isoprenoid biosynthesis protein ElbB [Rickettsiales bacterium]|nr:isoprenoid biosynthesis protein ElbB [Rickettsiales bacterium]|tara:strand:+ start:549 stop:1202 length:654 start_codon:yes stop_codon:yes gene_type:complete